MFNWPAYDNEKLAILYEWDLLIDFDEDNWWIQSEGECTWISFWANIVIVLGYDVIGFPSDGYSSVSLLVECEFVSQ